MRPKLTATPDGVVFTDSDGVHHPLKGVEGWDACVGQLAQEAFEYEFRMWRKSLCEMDAESFEL